jgi:tetratricopeptide (TPR) repeat protein
MRTGSVNTSSSRTSVNAYVALLGPQREGILEVAGDSRGEELELLVARVSVDRRQIDLLEKPEREPETESDEPPPRGRMAIAKEAFDKGQMTVAVGELDALIAENPNNSDALMLRGQIFKGHSDFTKARAYLIRAADAAPDNARAHELVGLVAVDLERYDECIVAFGEVIKLEPHIAANYRYRADCYELAGNVVPAVIDRKKACELNPTDERCQPAAPEGRP